ncbi:hypothetical protein Pelo_19890 [Pelomyxa schiedti]|nr:hypothetical protein Pelo_19890 [Pelomyxa schiedti]
MVETASGYEIDTSVTEWTVPLYNGELLDGTPLTVQVQGHFYSEVLLPSSATVSVVATVYGPPHLRRYHRASQCTLLHNGHQPTCTGDSG